MCSIQGCAQLADMVPPCFPFFLQYIDTQPHLFFFTFFPLFCPFLLVYLDVALGNMGQGWWVLKFFGYH